MNRLVSDLSSISRSRELSYPMATKQDFVAQMTRSGDPIVFDGVSYDAEFAAALIPDFFFPVESEADLVTKSTELLYARGLIGLPGGGVGEVGP